MADEAAGRTSHGVVLFQGKGEAESRIWEMAMRRGQFVSIYTERRMGRRADGSASEPWARALVPAAERHPKIPREPEGAEADAEYDHYEPTYDQQFLEMCRRCADYGGAPTVVLPATASDAEALRLLAEFRSIETGALEYLYERFYVVPRKNLRRPDRSRIALSHLMGSIRLNGHWAYFLGFFRGGDGVVAFLSESRSDVDGLFEPADGGRPVLRKAEWLHDHGVIETW